MVERDLADSAMRRVGQGEGFEGYVDCADPEDRKMLKRGLRRLMDRDQPLFIEHMANFDSLTGLPNRWLLNSRLELAIAESRDAGSRFMLVLLDLDGSKEVDDSLGHQAGYELLRQIKPRLQSLLPEGDTLARLGGDDFGTGYSSLSYLKHIPVQELKTDRSFVFDMLDDENDEVIVKSTVDLAHSLGIKVTAEGVENADLLAQLRSVGCDFMQGYHIAKPMPCDALLPWLETWQGPGFDHQGVELWSDTAS